MNVYVLSVIFSANPIDNKPYLLTVGEDTELLPLIEITHPDFFYREIFYQFKSMFVPNSIKIETECSYNFLSIQDEMSVKYVMDHYDFISKDDLIITYGGMLIKYDCLDNFKWTEYKINTQHKGFSSDINLNLLLDHVIQRSRI